MKAIDTDTVVEFLVGDDEQRFIEAFRLFREQQLFVSDEVAVESARRLGEAHHFSVGRVCDALGGMIELPNVHVSDAGRVGRAIERLRGGGDLAEALGAV